MEDPGLSRTDVHLPGTSMGFSIGVAVLLVIIFSSSIAVACCYYRDRFQSHHQSSPEPDIEQPPLKPEAMGEGSKFRHRESLPVLMPGDQVPKFVGLPCPSEPPREEKKIVEMQKATSAITLSTVS
ncbi:hypothetical protein CDL15_Pgr013380 [Punica granatum]|nr:hypothetical protein CDL15_Pgr013380 [Punica granatum]